MQRNIDETYKFEAELYVEHEGSHYDMKIHPPYLPVTTPMYHFIDCLVNDKPHIATGEEGLLVMEILDAIYQSDIDGAPVKIS